VGISSRVTPRQQRTTGTAWRHAFWPPITARRRRGRRLQAS